MQTDFLPKEVLSRVVDPYYFLLAPFSAAWHNYKVAFGQELTEVDIKTDQTANSFFTHAAMGLVLSVPVINTITFTYLVLKAKENYVVEDVESIVEKVILSNTSKKVEQKQIQPKTQDVVKPIIKPIEKPYIKPVIADEYPLRRSHTSPIVQARMKMFQNKVEEPFLQKQISTSRNLTKATLVKRLEAEVATNYFVLFPEESPHAIVRKSKDKYDSPLDEELAIVDKLILNSNDHQARNNVEGDINLPKFENAKTNIITLEDFLIAKFGEPVIHCYFQRTGGNHVNIFESNKDLPNEKNNAFEIIKKAIFSCPNANFLNLLNTFDFELYNEVIRVGHL